MEENPNEEPSEEIEGKHDDEFNEEELEDFEEESNEDNSNDSLIEREGEIIEELEPNSEDIEEAELNAEYDQEQEIEELETNSEDIEEAELNAEYDQEQEIEETLDKQQAEGESFGMDNSSEDTIIEEKALELDENTLHRNFIEAALYAAGGPLTIEELSNKLEFPKKEVEILVNELAFDYLERTTSLIIAQVGDRYQMQIRPEYTEKVSKFAKGGAIAERYLRTLTIIALKQPILKSMVIKLRGTGAYEHVKYLLDNDFINAVKKGRSQELTTTEKYAEMFGLPKDIRLMKQVMVKQLGIEEGGQPASPAEVEELEQNEHILESEKDEE